ncbi:myoneurin [Drosophila nasuta]|uniref:myoneurin n=1 Tax=Drosophila nasuta TaxID=42062 RepID=UPI00295E8921|nr:myoneurin [Drosophila nasuta]
MSSTTKETYPDVEAWCRLCLSEHRDAYTIFADDDSQLSVPMRLMACVSLEAKSTDGLPKKICGECRYQLEKSFLFRQRSQAADKKLRKHIRLVSMGKKSRVFSKSADQESDEDELEFEESIEFIDKLENVYEKHSQKWREKFKADQEKEFLTRVDLMREELRVDIRKELMDEVRQEVRQQLHEEVQEESRKEQLAKLLGELEVFLDEKKAGLWESIEDEPTENKPTNKSPIDASVTTPTKLTQTAAVETRSTRKRVRASPIQQQTKQRRTKLSEAETEYVLESTAKVEPLSTDDADQEEDASTPAVAESFTDVKIAGASDDVVTTQNGEIYIINAGKANSTPTSSIEYHQQDKNITSYNIRDNGEIQFTDTKSEDMSDVVVFNLNSEAGDDQQLYDFNDVIILSDGKANNELLPAAKSQKNDYVVKQSPRNAQPTIGRASDTLKSFQCQLCPIAFGTAKSLSRHISTHIKTMKNGVGGALKCPVCELQLSCASSLKRHMIIHTGLKPYKCDECSLAFSQREVLKRHMDTHTGEKRHQCPHCNACFAQKTNLQQHINRMHTEGERQHKCHLCHRSFNHVSGLSRHLVTHAGVTFACKECGRKFNDRSAVQRHVQNVHKLKDQDDVEGNENEVDFE